MKKERFLLVKKIVLYDGDCGLCNRTVQFVFRHNRTKDIYFASLQSPTGVQLLESYGLPTDEMDTFVYIRNEHAYTHSSGAIRLLTDLGGGWRISGLLYLFPRPLRDAVYRWVANNRHQWFSASPQCSLMTPEMKKRLLDE
jgi:predicted DCC family thiol-disulfide oxidoreductase YuxK